MKSTTGGQHSFANIPSAEIQRSAFNRSSGLKTTFSGGWLVPVLTEEALPGDTMSLRMNTFARLATPLHPVMENMFLDSFFFAVPMRLLWSNWQKFNGEQTDPGDSTDFTIPVIVSGVPGFAEESLEDYLGIPPNVPNITVSVMFARAYNLIWNEWFRDENLQDSIHKGVGDGPESKSNFTLMKRGKRRDYFTSCLPWPQKGEAVLLPLGVSAPVTTTLDAAASYPVTGSGAPTFDVGNKTGVTLGHDNAQAAFNVEWSADPTNSDLTAVWNDTKLVGVDIDGHAATGTADLSAATAATINSLREAFQIQKLYERDARGGSRYTEVIRAHFGVTSPDARLQRPEYLGGGTQNISITPIPQTSSTDGTSPQGNLAAYGVSTGNNHTFSKSFTEHCIVLGLVSVRADLNYQQGVPRMFTRLTRWDFYWPALAHLGEQAVTNFEIYAVGSDTPGQDDLVFGYQERWSEYRYRPSSITGRMRSSATVSLDTWHLAQDFTTLPLLDDTFIQETPPISRIVAVTSEPEFLFDAFFQIKHVRPMPTFSVPGLIDHF